jgi:hypothetical protein
MADGWFRGDLTRPVSTTDLFRSSSSPDRRDGRINQIGL